MSGDEGEKFFLDYWRFVDDAQGQEGVSERADQNTTLADAESDPAQSEQSDDDELPTPGVFVARSYPFQPAISPAEVDSDLMRRLLLRGKSDTLNSLESRAFKCPAGTDSCTSIGRPNRCCGAGETCEVVTDTGLGDVGCCSSGQTCSGVIGYCQQGYSACSDALGGGCCIPGYDCVPGGCESSHTSLTATLSWNDY